MIDANNLAARFRAFEDVIHLAYQKLQGGEVLSLDALEREADSLCKDLAQAEPAVARSFQSEVADMIARLDDLASALQDYKDNLKD